MKLYDLARAAGLSIEWTDANDRSQRVSDESLARVLNALGHRADDEAAISRSLEELAETAQRPPAMLTVDVGARLRLPPALAGASDVRLLAEDGREQALAVEHGHAAPVQQPGYYRLIAGAREIALAVAPPTCFRIEDVAARRIWGPAVQIPALRGQDPRGFGNLGELARTAERFATAGADAIAISPVHALYPGDGNRFSPYAPSSRQFLNAALADPELVGLPPLPDRPEADLIDWAAEIPAQHLALAALFRTLDPQTRQRVDDWAASRGEALRRHALYDTLHEHFARTGAAAWHDWPAEFHDPAGAAAIRFAERNADAVQFHIFRQWLSHEGLARVQARARAAGMAIGTIADLAVGVDPGGSDGWSMGDALLRGLTVGAPPDILGPDGQDWGLSTFSPEGLARHGFRPWLDMLRAALGACGGLRIDHAFGLRRLWVVPEGASSKEGAYLTYPFENLLRLLALESQRSRAVIVAEDLGTIPPGFRYAISAYAMMGMRVLWFERDHQGRFLRPDEYEAGSVAMTGTHDLPTVAGWWRGRDTDWNWKLERGALGESRQADEEQRAGEREQLWQAIGQDECRPQPEPDETAAVVDAATRFVAKTDSRLVLFPLEDVLGLEEQPNLPGTTDEHPNWRRRLPRLLDQMLEEAAVSQRLAGIAHERSR